jgi:hypothetical protein
MVRGFTPNKTPLTGDSRYRLTSKTMQMEMQEDMEEVIQMSDGSWVRTTGTGHYQGMDGLSQLQPVHQKKVSVPRMPCQTQDTIILSLS